jgi:hypothetical protein
MGATLAIIKLVNGGEAVEIVVFQESELTPISDSADARPSAVGCQARSAAFQIARGAPSPSSFR